MSKKNDKPLTKFREFFPVAIVALFIVGMLGVANADAIVARMQTFFDNNPTSSSKVEDVSKQPTTKFIDASSTPQPATTTPTSTSAPTSASNTHEVGCKTEIIVRSKTVYLDDPSMFIGEERVLSEGVDASRTECWSSDGTYSSDLVFGENREISRGTRSLDDSINSTTEPVYPPLYTDAEAGALAARYCNALLGPDGAANSSAFIECTSRYLVYLAQQQ